MQVREPTSIAVLGILCALSAACASQQEYKPLLGDMWNESAIPVVVHAEPKREIYSEIAKGGKRYADVEFNVSANFIGGIAGGSLGAWAGYSHAVATASRSSAVVWNPYVATASILIGPVVSGSIESVRQYGARNRAKPFLEYVDPGQGHQWLSDALFAESREIIGAPLPVLRATAAGLNRAKNRQVLEALGADSALLIASFPVFTPKFEVLELTLVYALIEREVQPQKGNSQKPGFTVVQRYANTIVVQSTQRTALDGSDQRNEIDSFIADRTARREAQIRQMNRRSPFRRSEELRRLSRKQDMLHNLYRRRYVAFDDRDERGTRWLADSGADFLRELELLYQEAARLLVADLKGRGHMSGRTATTAPGYSEELYEIVELRQPDRVVYRFESGELISINARSRLIPPSSDD